jgi:hypothetical protein
LLPISDFAQKFEALQLSTFATKSGVKRTWRGARKTVVLDPTATPSVHRGNAALFEA